MLVYQEVEFATLIKVWRFVDVLFKVTVGINFWVVQRVIFYIKRYFSPPALPWKIFLLYPGFHFPHLSRGVMLPDTASSLLLQILKNQGLKNHGSFFATLAFAENGCVSVLNPLLRSQGLYLIIFLHWTYCNTGR